MADVERTVEVADDIEQQKSGVLSYWPRRMLVAIGVFTLYSFIVFNEGAVRAAEQASLPFGGSWTKGDQVPQVVLLIAAVGEIVFGITGLLMGLALLFHKFGNKFVTMGWMALALIFGWFVYIVYVLAVPIYNMANLTNVPVTTMGQTTLPEYNTMRSMGLFAGMAWCFALQGGQFMAGNMIRSYQASSHAQGSKYAKARMLMWSVNAIIAGIAFLVAGSVQQSISKGPLALIQVYEPIFMKYPEMTIAGGAVTIVFGVFAAFAALTAKMLSTVSALALFTWLVNLTLLVWGQVWLDRLQVPTSLLGGLSFTVFANVAYAASELDLEHTEAKEESE